MSVRQVPRRAEPHAHVAGVGVGAGAGAGAGVDGVTAALPLLALDPTPAARTGELVGKDDTFTYCTVDIIVGFDPHPEYTMPFRIQTDVYSGKPMVNPIDMDRIAQRLKEIRSEPDYASWLVIVPSQTLKSDDGEIIWGVPNSIVGLLQARMTLDLVKLAKYLVRTGETDKCRIYFSKTWPLSPGIQASNYSDWGLRLGGRDPTNEEEEKGGPPPGDGHLPAKFRGTNVNPNVRNTTCPDYNEKTWSKPRVRTYAKTIGLNEDAVDPSKGDAAVDAARKLLPDVDPNRDAAGRALPTNYTRASAKLGCLSVLRRAVQAPGVAFEFDAKWAKNPNAVTLSSHGRNACCILTPGSQYEEEYNTFQPIIEIVSQALFLKTTDLVQPVGVEGQPGYKTRSQVVTERMNSSWNAFQKVENGLTGTYRMPESRTDGYNWYATPTGDVFRVAATPQKDRATKLAELAAQKAEEGEPDKALPDEMLSLCNAVADYTWVLVRFSAKLWTAMRLNMLRDDVPPPAQPLFAAMLRAGNWKSVNELLTGVSSADKYDKTIYVNLGQFSVVEGSYEEPEADKMGKRVGGKIKLRKDSDAFLSQLLDPASAYIKNRTKYRLDYLLSTIILRGAVLYGSNSTPLKAFAYVSPSGECKPDPTYRQLLDYATDASLLEATNRQMAKAKAKLMQAELQVSSRKQFIKEAKEQQKNTLVMETELEFAEQDLQLEKMRWRRWERLKNDVLEPVTFSLEGSDALGNIVEAFKQYLGYYKPSDPSTYVQNYPDKQTSTPRAAIINQDMDERFDVRAYTNSNKFFEQGEVAGRTIAPELVLEVVKKAKHATLLDWYREKIPKQANGKVTMDPLAGNKVVSHDNELLVRDAIRQMLYAAYEAHRHFLTAEEANDAQAELNAGPAELDPDAAELDPDAADPEAPEMPVVHDAGPAGPSSCVDVPDEFK